MNLSRLLSDRSPPGLNLAAIFSPAAAPPLASRLRPATNRLDASERIAAAISADVNHAPSVGALLIDAMSG